MFDGRQIKNIVILSGAGISAESGLATFRDSGGLWEQHDPRDIATPEALAHNPALVYGFYNARRAQLGEVSPNAAHQAIARLQAAGCFSVLLVTQNVDDLHERGGSQQVLHMHGQLRSMLCRHCDQRWPTNVDFDDSIACPGCGLSGGLRPDIVFFGEVPYHLEQIDSALRDCDLFIAVGTSGQVYPAAGFVQLARLAGAHCIEVNREVSDVGAQFHEHRTGTATDQVSKLVDELLA